MVAKPTKTPNRLHFTDLNPTRFEDFCLALIFPLYAWLDIQHYGRLGSDGGVDIFGRERLDDESTRTWFIQCRRYSKAPLSTLKQAVDDALLKSPFKPDVLLVVVACDVRRDGHQGYIKYALERGVATPLLWTAALLEARLYAERKDLLFAYFDISVAQRARSRESSTRRNLAMKRRVAKELIKSKYELKIGPWGKFEQSEAIIHSVDDTSYPEVDPSSVGISGWFKVEWPALPEWSIGWTGMPASALSMEVRRAPENLDEQAIVPYAHVRNAEVT